MVIAYLGFNGAGKTLAMTKAATGYDTVFCNYGYLGLPGQKVCFRSNVERLMDLLRQYNSLVEIGREKVCMAIDEAGLNFPARSWKNISKREAYLFAQHRKMGIDLLYTAQNAKMVDSILRNNTAMSVYPRHFFGLFWESMYEGVERSRDMFLYRSMWFGGRYYGLYSTKEIVESTKFYIDDKNEDSEQVKDWGEVFRA